MSKIPNHDPDRTDSKTDLAQSNGESIGELEPWDDERDGYIPRFFQLTPEQQHELLLRAARQAVEDMRKPAPEPTPAGTEATRRDFAALLLFLGGATVQDIDFMFDVEPDGSRVAGLDRHIDMRLREEVPDDLR